MSAESLPVEIEPPQTTKRWWIPIAIAIVTLVAANAILVVAGVRHAPRHEERLLEAKWALAGNSDRTFDWVVLGDSSATLGIAPQTLSRELGGPSINLATFGGMGLIGDVWMLDHYLAHHQPPRGVIVVHAAEVWTGYHGEAFYQYAAAVPITTSSLLHRLIALHSRPSELFITLRYRDWFPLLLLKDRLRGSVDRSLADNDANEVALQLPSDGTWRMGSLQARPASVTAASATYMADIAGDAELDWQHHVALEKLAARAREDGFQLYLAGGPIARPVRESATFDAKVRGVAKQLTQLADDDPNVFYVLRDWVAFDPEVMENCNHVVGPAVDDYTTELARAIHQSFSGHE